MEKDIEFLLYGHQFKRLYEQEIASLREEYDLKKIDIHILYHLYHSDNSDDTPKAIMELNSLNKGHISQSVCHLQNQGLLVSVHDEFDRRCIHLKLTKEAVGVVRQIEKIHKRLSQIVFKDIEAEEKEILLKVVKKICANIESALD